MSDTAPPPPGTAGRGTLFEQVAAVLQQSYYDRAFREGALAALVAEFRPVAQGAATHAQAREIVWSFLSRIPASHLALLSRESKRMLENELFGRPYPTFGFQLLRWQGRFYACMVLSGGPAQRAGIRNWDEVVQIDGLDVAASPLLDWRSDDAHLPDDRDPPMHALLGGEARFRIRRSAVEDIEVPIAAEPYSALQAVSRSAQVFVREGVRIGHIHFWYLHAVGLPEAIQEAFDSPLQDIAALVLDLRGRGGSASVVAKLLRLLEPGPAQRFDGPVVALVDRQSRSGKEALAYELRARGLARIVGEPTAGAVIPASFADVGDDVLMYPPMTMPVYTDLLELQPCPPDVHVAWGGPLSGDHDPILEAGLTHAQQLVHASRPGRVLARRSVASGAAPAGAAPASLDELLEQMTKAFGGEAALQAPTRVVSAGTARMIDTPITGSFECVATHAHYESTMELAGGIRLVQRVDGDEVRLKPPGAESFLRLEGAQAIPLRWQALRAPALAMRTAFPSAHVEAADTFDDRPCVRVRLGGEDDSAVLLFVDMGSWLPRGLRYTAPSPLGMLDAAMYFRSYRDVAGVQMPDVIVFDAAGQQIEVTIRQFITERDDA